MRKTQGGGKKTYILGGFADILRTLIEAWQCNNHYLVYTLRSEVRNSSTEVFHHLIRKSDNWSVWTPPNFELRYYGPALAGMITDVTRLEYVDSRKSLLHMFVLMSKI
jgi:hypothetical protein